MSKRKLFLTDDFSGKILKKDLCITDFPNEILKEILTICLTKTNIDFYLNFIKTHICFHSWKLLRLVCKTFYHSCNSIKCNTMKIPINIWISKLPLKFPRNQVLDIDISSENNENDLFELMNDKVNIEYIEKLKMKYFGSAINLYNILKKFKNVSELEIVFFSTNTFQNFNWSKMEKFPNLQILRTNVIENNPHVPICNMNLSRTKLKQLYIQNTVPIGNFFLNVPTTLEILNIPNVKHIKGATPKLKELIFRRNLRGDFYPLSWPELITKNIKILCVNISPPVTLDVNGFPLLEKLTLSFVKSNSSAEFNPLDIPEISQFKKLKSLTLILFCKNISLTNFASPSIEELVLICPSKTKAEINQKDFPNLKLAKLCYPYSNTLRQFCLEMKYFKYSIKIPLANPDSASIPPVLLNQSNLIYSESLRYWLGSKASLF